MRFLNQGDDFDIDQDEGEDEDDFIFLDINDSDVGQLFKFLISFCPIFFLALWYFDFVDDKRWYFSSYLCFQERQWWRLITGLIVVGPPKLDNWLIVILFAICLIANPEKSTYCVMVLLHSIIGAYISYYISPTPYIAPRMYAIFLFIILKTFSTKIIKIFTELGFGAAWIPFLDVIFSFWTDSQETFLSILFIFFWAHCFYFFDVIVPKYTPYHITKAPAFIEWVFSINLE
ncbi:hypothetical protein M9Y10_045900 [Tritrichomonas musculus]|uniref:Derlin n=1 Tax=Tritrichomonas musculus TaxID=1915356 RepID=A0ABR2JWJ8_9EUKA